jgi:hypothetical protein
MDRKQKSIQLIRLYQALRDSYGWTTGSELAREAGIAGRTARAHLAVWVSFDQVEVRHDLFPPRYRIAHPESDYWRGMEEVAKIYEAAPNAEAKGSL